MSLIYGFSMVCFDQQKFAMWGPVHQILWSCVFVVILLAFCPGGVFPQDTVCLCSEPLNCLPWGDISPPW